MIEWWGPVLLEYWGGSEGGVTTLVDSREWLAHPGTVGRALPHYEVFAVDERGRAAPARRRGARSSAATARRRASSSTTRAEAKTGGAYLPDDPNAFTLGDVGSVDADGWVYLADRESNMIISGGVNIYPQEIERVLAEHPAVADVGVFGIPDDEWGERVKAAVELAAGLRAGAGARGGAPRLRARAARRLQGAALDRLRGVAAAHAGREALRAKAQGPLLAGPRPPDLNEVGSPPHVAEETRSRDRRLVHARRRRRRSSSARAARALRRVFFPRESAFCRNPRVRGPRVRGGAARAGAAGSGRAPTTATRRRRPTCRSDPFEPYAIAAVELERREDGRARPGRARRRARAISRSAMEMELVLGTLYEDDEQRVRRLEVEARAEGGAPSE